VPDNCQLKLSKVVMSSQCVAAAAAVVTSSSVSTVPRQSATMNHFLTKDQVTKAEIIWALHWYCVTLSVWVNRSAANVFHLMPSVL